MSVSWHQKHPTKQQLRQIFEEISLATFWNCKMHAVSSQGLKVLLYTKFCQRVLNKQKDKHCKRAWCFEGSCKHSPISWAQEYIWSEEVDQMPELGDGFMPWAYHAVLGTIECTSIWSHYHVFLEPPATKSPHYKWVSPFCRFRTVSKSVPGTLPMLIGQTCPASSSQGDSAWTPQRAPSRRRHIRRRGAPPSLVKGVDGDTNLVQSNMLPNIMRNG